MNSILQQLNQNSDKQSNQELIQSFASAIDQELNRLYARTDCVDNYQQYFQKSKDNSRQYYHCVQNLCQFSTNKSSLIVRHIRRHLKEKPYLCPIDDCKDRFYQKCDLRCHMIRHFEDKPFKCEVLDCPKTYTTRKALSLHTKTHSPFTFDCKECHKMFATNWKLNKHSKDCHTLPDQPMSETLIKNNNKPKSEPIIELNSKLKTVSKVRDKPTVNSLTNGLIHSIDSINEQMKEEFLSKASITSLSAEFGFEEVINYVIQNCGQPSNRRTKVENEVQITPQKVVDTKNVVNPEPEKDSNSTANQTLLNCVENVCSLIEIYTFESMDANKKVLFKCINCVFTSDTIEVMVGHIFHHISQRVIQSLKNKVK